MTNKTVTMSRELAEKLVGPDRRCFTFVEALHGLRAILAESATCAKSQVESAATIVERHPVSWSNEKPESPGAYWIRGFNLSGEFNQAALVQVILDNDTQVLMVNLHQSNTETDTGFWYEVYKIDEQFEWCGPLFAAPIVEADGMGEAANSIAQMVTEWVETGIKMDTDWRNGLSGIIQKHLARFPASPQSVDLSELRDYHVKAIGNLKSYADDSGLRDSDVKHYTKRARFHENLVALIDKVKDLNTKPR